MLALLKRFSVFLAVIGIGLSTWEIHSPASQKMDAESIRLLEKIFEEMRGTYSTLGCTVNISFPLFGGNDKLSIEIAPIDQEKVEIHIDRPSGKIEKGFDQKICDDVVVKLTEPREHHTLLRAKCDPSRQEFLIEYDQKNDRIKKIKLSETGSIAYFKSLFQMLNFKQKSSTTQNDEGYSCSYLSKR